MRSMISSSERALARSDFRRFWPLLFGYAMLWLCALPLSLWSRHDYLSPRRPMEAMASVSNCLYNASRAPSTSPPFSRCCWPWRCLPT